MCEHVLVEVDLGRSEGFRIRPLGAVWGDAFSWEVDLGAKLVDGGQLADLGLLGGEDVEMRKVVVADFGICVNRKLDFQRERTRLCIQSVGVQIAAVDSVERFERVERVQCVLRGGTCSPRVIWRRS